MVNYLDPAQYKKCQKKMYDIFVCRPPKNTVVINKLEQFNVVRALNGKTFFSADEVATLQRQNSPVFQQITQAVNSGMAYVVNENTPFVLAGTMGEMWCIDAKKLAERYTLISGEPINAQTLGKREKNGVLDWTGIRTRPDNSKAWACFVPKSQKGQVQTKWKAVLNFNGEGVSHGKGDFIIAQDMGGRPNLNDIYVVNGVVFGATYNNQGWTQYLDQKANSSSISKEKLPKITASVSGFTAIFSTLVQNIMLVFQSEGFVVNINSTPEEMANCRARMRVSEAENGRESTIFFSVDNKTGKFRVKCKRGGKVFDEEYSISQKAENKLGVIFLCVYLDFCSLFKMTPFRFVTRPRFVATSARNITSSYNIIAVKVNPRSFENDFAENCSASARFRFSTILDTDDSKMALLRSKREDEEDFNWLINEYKHNCLIDNSTAEIRVRLNKTKLKSLIADAKKTGNINPDLSKQSFSISLKVAYAPVMELNLNMVMKLGTWLVNGVEAEKERQRTSNVKAKGKKLYESYKKVVEEYMKKDKHKMSIYKSMPSPISHYQKRFEGNAKVLKSLENLKKGIFKVGADSRPWVLCGYAINENNFIGYLFMFKGGTTEISTCDFYYGAGGFCVPMSEQYNDEVLQDALNRCMDKYCSVH